MDKDRQPAMNKYIHYWYKASLINKVAAAGWENLTVCLFYFCVFLAIFIIAAAIFPVFNFFFLELNLFPALHCLVLCSAADLLLCEIGTDGGMDIARYLTYCYLFFCFHRWSLLHFPILCHYYFLLLYALPFLQPTKGC